MKGDNGTTRLAMGPWSVTLSDETMHLTRAQTARLEQLLASYRSIVLPQYRAEYGDNWCSRICDGPSLVVRIDMQPMAGEAIGLYEIEANPCLLGTIPRVGIDIAPPVIDAFRIMGVDTIQSFVAPSRLAQKADHEAFLEQLEREGITVRRRQPPDASPALPVWPRAGEEDIDLIRPILPGCLIQPRDGGGQKEYLLALGQARRLCTWPRVDAIFDDYPSGFVIKPFRSWGTKNMHVWSPEKPWKPMGWTRTRMKEQLRGLRAAGSDRDYLVQPFYPPEHRGGRRARIWRIYAVLGENGYRVIGGFWNERRSLRVHGASDACLGAILAHGTEST